MSSTATPFHCITCGYDISSLRGECASMITCPECGKHTDPYNTHAPRIRRQHPAITLLLSAMVWLLPGMLFGLILSLHFLMIFLLVPVLYPATRLNEKQLQHRTQRQRLLARLAIIAGALLGFGGGAVLYFTLLGLIR